MILDPVPDVLGPEWVARTIPLPPDEEGEVMATLVSASDAPQHARAVLFVHGWVDYFFQAEHARRWIEQGYDFYALDLRKHGRSLRPHQTPNYITDLRGYGAEMGEAVRHIRATHPGDGLRVVLLGSSVGGLIASLWANAHPGAVDALVLNSPSFDHRGPWWESKVLTGVAEMLGSVAPRTVLAHPIEPYYGRMLHAATGGPYDFNLAWKPHHGFPARAGWARSVRRGHARVQEGLDIKAPVLVCASTANAPQHRESPELATADCVLDVEDMVRYAPGLGADVTVAQIEGGLHDLALSQPEARRAYETAVFDWLGEKIRSAQDAGGSD